MKTVENITLDWVYARVIDIDGCLVWSGACGNNGKLPQARIGGEAMGMRRVMWVLTHEREIPQNRRISMACQNEKCIHPDHVQANKINAAFKGVKKTLVHRSNIAHARRTGSKWGEDVIRAIKDSDKPVKELALTHGMNASYVHYIQRDRARRNFSNPYLQLGQR